jgi:hypothetical protein
MPLNPNLKASKMKYEKPVNPSITCPSYLPLGNFIFDHLLNQSIIKSFLYSIFDRLKDEIQKYPKGLILL